jgi:hypothetical protein
VAADRVRQLIGRVRSEAAAESPATQR